MKQVGTERHEFFKEVTGLRSNFAWLSRFKENTSLFVSILFQTLLNARKIKCTDFSHWSVSREFKSSLHKSVFSMDG